VTTPGTPPDKPSSVRPVDYKGEPLDAERGPGLGCFWAQMVLLVTFIVLTPLTVAWNMPSWVSIVLLFVTIILLLLSGQTVIFLLRLVASDRREGRRVPLAGASPTVGEIEDTLPPPDDTSGPGALRRSARGLAGACGPARARRRARIGPDRPPDPGGPSAPCLSWRPTSPSVAAATRSSSSS
jgi:hypothetical protein